MNKKQSFDKVAEACGADPEVLAEVLEALGVELVGDIQEWFKEVEEAWEEAQRQEEDYQSTLRSLPY